MIVFKAILLCLMCCAGSLYSDSRFSSLGNVIFDSENDSNNTIVYDTKGQMSIGTTSATNTLTLQGSGNINGELLTEDLKTKQMLRNFILTSTDLSIGDEALVLVDTSSGNITVTLPQANQSTGRIIEVKKTLATGYVEIVSADAGLIEKRSSYIITRAGDSFGYAKFVSDGTEWFVLEHVGGVYSQKSISFDGVDDYINVGPDNGFIAAGNFTISFWFKLRGYNSNPFMSAYDPGTELNIDYGTYLLNAFYIDHGDYSNSSRTVNANDGQWHHFATVFSDNIQCYFNGNLIHEELNISGTMADTAEPILLGAESDLYLNAFLDEVSIFNSGLSAEEVQELYNYGIPGDVTKHTGSDSLVNYWPLGEGDTVDKVQDLSGSGNHGTMFNNPTISGDVP